MDGDWAFNTLNAVTIGLRTIRKIVELFEAVHMNSANENLPWLVIFLLFLEDLKFA